MVSLTFRSKKLPLSVWAAFMWNWLLSILNNKNFLVGILGSIKIFQQVIFMDIE